MTAGYLDQHAHLTAGMTIESVLASALGLMDLGLDRDVTELSGGQRTKVLLGKLLREAHMNKFTCFHSAAYATGPL